MSDKKSFLLPESLSDEAFREVREARARGLAADEALKHGGYFSKQLLTPTEWYGQAPSPRTAARVIADLRILRTAFEACSEETLDLFTDPVEPRQFQKWQRGEDFRDPKSLLDRLEYAEWLYPSGDRPLSQGDRPLTQSIQGRPLRYVYLEPTFVLLQAWKDATKKIEIGSFRNQSFSADTPARYRFSPMIEFIGDVLLIIDPSLETEEEDRPTVEGDPHGRRTSAENARHIAWSSATQLRKMIHYENSAGVRRLFGIDD